MNGPILAQLIEVVAAAESDPESWRAGPDYTLWNELLKFLLHRMKRANELRRMMAADRLATLLAGVYEEMPAYDDTSSQQETADLIRRRSVHAGFNILDEGAMCDLAITRYNVTRYGGPVPASVQVAAKAFGRSGTQLYKYRRDELPADRPWFSRPLMSIDERLRFLLGLVGFQTDETKRIIPFLRSQYDAQSPLGRVSAWTLLEPDVINGECGVVFTMPVASDRRRRRKKNA